VSVGRYVPEPVPEFAEVEASPQPAPLPPSPVDMTATLAALKEHKGKGATRKPTGINPWAFLVTSAAMTR
jgi:hypothetical protein